MQSFTASDYFISAWYGWIQVHGERVVVAGGLGNGSVIPPNGKACGEAMKMSELIMLKGPHRTTQRGPVVMTSSEELLI